MSRICPSCSEHEWSDDVAGEQTCPQCHTLVRLVAGGFAALPKRYSFRQSQKAPKRLRDSVVVAGKVLCACCGLPFDPPGSVTGEAVLDGTLETDGKQLIEARIGWTFTGTEFVPAYQMRSIPKRIRGLVCVDCSMMGVFHLIGKMQVDTHPESIKSMQSDCRPTKEFQNLAPTSPALAFEKHKNPERFQAELEFALAPEWSRSGDSSWLTDSVIETDWYDDTPPETIAGDLELIRRNVHRTALLRRLFRRSPTKWSIERLLNLRFYQRGLDVFPAPTVGHYDTRPLAASLLSPPPSNDYLKRLVASWPLRKPVQVTRFIVEPTADPKPLKSLGTAAEPRNKCKHGIQPFRAYDKTARELIYCCSLCRPRPQAEP